MFTFSWFLIVLGLLGVVVWHCFSFRGLLVCLLLFVCGLVVCCLVWVGVVYVCVCLCLLLWMHYD